MNRRRSTPWIHRWSRPILAAIALIGASVTAYLTVIKLSGNSAACPTSGCEQVLASPYATVFGLPLTLFGFLAYASMGVMALSPLWINSETQKKLRPTVENWSWLFLFIGATAMTVFSSYLMYVLATKLQVPCTYCIGSALLSSSLFVITLLGRSWEDVGQLFFTGIVVAMVVLVGTLGVYANVDKPATAQKPGEVVLAPPQGQLPKPGIGWEVTTTSGEAEIELAKHLTKVGAKEYGAWWCPHCHEQKQMFGKEAHREINDIECADNPQDPRDQAEVCEAANIKGYPTWVINGKTLEGPQDLHVLANESGYQGPRNFRNLPKQP
jgi:uncharacterized membrane protein